MTVAPTAVGLGLVFFSDFYWKVDTFMIPSLSSTEGLRHYGRVRLWIYMFASCFSVVVIVVSFVFEYCVVVKGRKLTKFYININAQEKRRNRSMCRFIFRILIVAVMYLGMSCVYFVTYTRCRNFRLQDYHNDYIKFTQKLAKSMLSDNYEAGMVSWDVTHNIYDCCGLNGYEDWKLPYQRIPNSCCRGQTIIHHCPAGEIKQNGCLPHLISYANEQIRYKTLDIQTYCLIAGLLSLFFGVILMHFSLIQFCRISQHSTIIDDKRRHENVNENTDYNANINFIENVGNNRMNDDVGNVDVHDDIPNCYKPRIPDLWSCDIGRNNKALSRV